VAIANALQLETVRLCARRCRLCLANFLLGMRTDCYFTASDQNYEVVIRFSQPNVKRAIIWLLDDVFHAVTLTFDTWSWMSVVHRVSCG